MALGFLSAFSIECTVIDLPVSPPPPVTVSLNIYPITAYLLIFNEGSSSIWIPRVSSILSGLSIFKNASTSPIAGK